MTVLSVGSTVSGFAAPATIVRMFVAIEMTVCARPMIFATSLVDSAFTLDVIFWSSAAVLASASREPDAL
jgi:hypothetical protein